MKYASEIQIVWLKRDLRLRDHAPLSEAIRAKLPTLIVYWLEPSLVQSAESDVRHWRFVYESLQAMRAQLSRHGIPLYILHAEVLPTLQHLLNEVRIVRLLSYQETGLKITFDRDRAVRHFCQRMGIIWQEFAQDGIRRGASNRNGWQTQLEQYLNDVPHSVNLADLQPFILSERLEQQLCRPALPAAITKACKDFQPGGEHAAWRYLQSFFAERATNYNRHLSKPLYSRRSCSRLSPYIAWGNLSVREIYQWTLLHQNDKALAAPMRNFQSRLWWRSHYIQKLESLWRLEFEPINLGFSALKRNIDEHFEAWAQGRTGFPMVDASMRCLMATGWVNFRMRAMLATFATFTLWQDWRAAAQHLARLFLDYEPGIHFAQFQMQAGLTGYHTMRIFNPIVQAQRHDTDGAFVRQWLPELQQVPIPQLYTPWAMTNMEQTFYNCRIGVDYPAPIVDYDEATRHAKTRYWCIRQSPEVQAHLPAIWERLCLPTDIDKYKNQTLPTAPDATNALPTLDIIGQ